MSQWAASPTVAPVGGARKAAGYPRSEVKGANRSQGYARPAGKRCFGENKTGGYIHRRGAQSAVGQAHTQTEWRGDRVSRSARWHAGRCSAGGLTEGGGRVRSLGRAEWRSEVSRRQVWQVRRRGGKRARESTETMLIQDDTSKNIMQPLKTPETM